jgi:hypothetical protein
MFCRDAPGGHQGSHRLDALALTRHQEPEAVIPQWLLPVGMPDHLGQKSLAIGPEPLFPVAHPVIHDSHHPLLESRDYQTRSRPESPLPSNFVTQQN